MRAEENYLRKIVDEFLAYLADPCSLETVVSSYIALLQMINVHILGPRLLSRFTALYTCAANSRHENRATGHPDDSGFVVVKTGVKAMTRQYLQHRCKVR